MILRILCLSECPPYLPECPIQDFEDSTVDTLIDPLNRQWVVELVDGLFTREDAEMIKKIPLGRASSEDTLFWPHSSNGVYSCKTGYRFLKEEAAALGEVAQDQQSRDKHIWKSIWSLRTPQKVKTMPWRACREALPTKQALVRRTIIEDPVCERCCNSAETSLHALWRCPELDPMWANPELWSFRNSVHFLDFKELLLWLTLQKKDVELFAVMV